MLTFPKCAMVLFVSTEPFNSLFSGLFVPRFAIAIAFAIVLIKRMLMTNPMELVSLLPAHSRNETSSGVFGSPYLLEISTSNHIVPSGV